MRKFNIEINPRVEKDLLNSIDYYKKINKKIATNFLKDFKNTIALLKQNPNYQVRYKEVRCIPLKNYPFMLHFKTYENLIIVYALIHTSLNPNENWIE